MPQNSQIHELVKSRIDRLMALVKWFEGGELHREKLQEWKALNYDRDSILALAGDKNLWNLNRKMILKDLARIEESLKKLNLIKRNPGRFSHVFEAIEVIRGAIEDVKPPQINPQKKEKMLQDLTLLEHRIKHLEVFLEDLEKSAFELKAVVNELAEVYGVSVEEESIGWKQEELLPFFS